jgi:hypothetical protein
VIWVDEVGVGQDPRLVAFRSPVTREGWQQRVLTASAERPGATYTRAPGQSIAVEI